MLISCCLFLCLGTALAAIDWWKSSIVYQIYPRSFADSNGDGDGDLKGILQHVDYLKDLGVGVVWVSPIYKSPMKDMGYDISDWKDVNPLFGNLDDVKKLIEAFHQRNIKFFMDMVPNHSSDQHPWFNASRYESGDEKDFYVWKEPKGWSGSDPVPPNNWVSVFQGVGSAWTYDKVRKQFYLHQFGSYQPDLNYANPKIVDAMFDNMDFWLQLGVDGFRMDAVPFLVEDDQFRDEPLKPDCDDPINCLNHVYTQNQPGTYKVLKELDDRISKKYGEEKYMFLEVYAPLHETMDYYYKHSAPFNFLMISNLTQSTSATALKKTIDRYMTSIPNGTWPNWVTGNHDNSRVGTRMGPDFIDAANMLNLLLPGTTVTFQGEELGMTDGYLLKSKVLDCCGRDPERMPMQWDDTDNAGFSSSKKGTWLPVNPNYWQVNAKLESKDDTSHLSTFKRLVKLRSELVESTDLQTTTIGDWVFAFQRSHKKKKYYVIINMNNIEEEVILNKGFKDMPAKLSVHTPSDNAGFKVGASLDTTAKIILRPRSGMVLSNASGVMASIALIISSLVVLFYKS